MNRFLTFLRYLLWQKEWAPLALVLVLGMIIGALEHAEGQEVVDFQIHTPECDSCFSYFEPLPRVWNNEIQIHLNAENRPSWASTGDIINAIEWAIDYIERYVDIPIVYQVQTNSSTIGEYNEERRNTVLVEFTDYPAPGRADIWWNWHGKQEINYGEVQLNAFISQNCLKGVFLHEFLHVLYIDHNTNTQNSIMAASPYNSCQYQTTLRLADIKAVQSLYPPKPNLEGAVDANGCWYVPETIYEGQSIQATLCGPASVEYGKH